MELVTFYFSLEFWCAAPCRFCKIGQTRGQQDVRCDGFVVVGGVIADSGMVSSFFIWPLCWAGLVRRLRQTRETRPSRDMFVVAGGIIRPTYGFYREGLGLSGACGRRDGVERVCPAATAAVIDGGVAVLIWS